MSLGFLITIYTLRSKNIMDTKITAQKGIVGGLIVGISIAVATFINNHIALTDDQKQYVIVTTGTVIGALITAGKNIWKHWGKHE